MVQAITPYCPISHYLALQRAISSGGINIDDLLKGNVQVTIPSKPSKTQITVPASDAIFKAKVNEDSKEDEIIECLTFLANKVPEELLPDLIRLFLAIQTKDNDTAYHSARVCMYAAKLGEMCKLDEEEYTTLLVGSLLHDIGKLEFPDYIFQNDDELTSKELEIVRKHPADGERIIKRSNIGLLKTLMPGLTIPIRSHHENIDGNGYPDGLKGMRIPLLARILKLADCLDAMTKQRSYHEAIPLDIVLERIYKDRDKQFGGDLVKLLETITDELAKGELLKSSLVPS